MHVYYLNILNVSVLGAASPLLEFWPPLLLGIYCLLIMLSALSGGWLPQLMNLTHTRMQTVISFVGGLMLGTGVFHMLPHAVRELDSVDRAVWWMMMGVITLFFLLRMFHFHDHSLAETALQKEDHSHEHPHCDHTHHHAHKLSWTGIFLGLSIHTLIDGLALGASIQGEASRTPGFALLGLGTFMAIVLHKPLDAVAITSLMSAGGWSQKWQLMVSAGFALMCPLGAALFFFGVRHFTDYQSVVVGCSLAFSAGVFLCISLGDLLPEMEFHSHDRIRLSIALLLGIAISWGIVFVEPSHQHNHPTPPTPPALSTQSQ